jgi:hypothetical protein
VLPTDFPKVLFDRDEYSQVWSRESGQFRSQNMRAAPGPADAPIPAANLTKRRRAFADHIAISGSIGRSLFVSGISVIVASDAEGKPYADKSAAGIKQQHVEKLMDLRAAKPDSANGLRKALREMMKVAVKLEWRKDDPTQGVKKLKPKRKGGFHRWTDAEIAQFESRHPVGSKARLAMTLGLYTGQARQDVIAIGEQHIGIETDEEGREYEALHWVRLKTEDSTGLALVIPVHPTLREVIDATPSGHALFLVPATATSGPSPRLCSMPQSRFATPTVAIPPRCWSRPITRGSFRASCLTRTLPRSVVRLRRRAKPRSLLRQTCICLTSARSRSSPTG